MAQNEYDRLFPGILDGTGRIPLNYFDYSSPEAEKKTEALMAAYRRWQENQRISNLSLTNPIAAQRQREISKNSDFSKRIEMQTAKIGTVEFPPFLGININMMPFVIGDEESIPPEYRGYAPLVTQCQIDPDEIGKVGYLSISESIVEAGTSQRRGGIHTEKHPKATWGGGWGGGMAQSDVQPSAGWGSGWGCGKNLKQGLFMASTVDDSCMVWNTYIETPGPMGDCGHLRSSLGMGTLIKANELYWLTDSCPHEALTQTVSGPRQWFRFVTSPVGLWYEEHSTPNRFGVVPNCPIIQGSKFN